MSKLWPQEGRGPGASQIETDDGSGRKRRRRNGMGKVIISDFTKDLL